MPLRLNLGCSDDHIRAYLNVDIHPPADVLADLNARWPWPDGSVERIVAHDVFEHLDGSRQWEEQDGTILERDNDTAERRTVAGKVWAMNEAHRVLEPGGVLELAVPCVMLSDGRVNPGAFADPTHRTYWTMDDQYYFCEEWNNLQGERGRLGPAYGITALFRPHTWTLVEYGKGPERRSKIVATLEALKGGRMISPVGIASGEGFGRV